MKAEELMNKLLLHSMQLLFLGLWHDFITFNRWKSFASDVYLVLALKLENGLCKSIIFNTLSPSWLIRFFFTKQGDRGMFKGIYHFKATWWVDGGGWVFFGIRRCFFCHVWQEIWGWQKEISILSWDLCLSLYQGISKMCWLREVGSLLDKSQSFRPWLMAWTPQWSASVRWELFFGWGDGNFLLLSGIKGRLITHCSHEWGLAELAWGLGAYLIRDRGSKGMWDLRYNYGKVIGCGTKHLPDYFLYLWEEIGALETDQVGTDTTQRQRYYTRLQ